MESFPSVVTIAPPPIPVGCLCAFTWHPAGDGRTVRNGPRAACAADHSAIDEAAQR